MSFIDASTDLEKKLWREHSAFTEIAREMFLALKNLPCSCQHNVPYAGGSVDQFVTVQCGRCRCIEKYEKLAAQTSTTLGVKS